MVQAVGEALASIYKEERDTCGEMGGSAGVGGGTKLDKKRGRTRSPAPAWKWQSEKISKDQVNAYT